MTLQRGDIVLVPFPFTDLSRQKARPAVVVSSRSFNDRYPDVILAAISSKLPDPPSDLEIVIQADSVDFQPTGLRVSSVIRVPKLVAMKQSLIYSGLGKLTPRTLGVFDDCLARAVGLLTLREEMAARQAAQAQLRELAAKLAVLERRLAEAGQS